MKSLLLEMKEQADRCKEQGLPCLPQTRQQELIAKYDLLVEQGYQQSRLIV